VPVIRSEEVELKVLPRFMPDVLAIDHHAELEVPLWDREVVLEAADARREWGPLLPLGGELLERQPAPVAGLDRVGAAPRGEQAEDIALEKGRIHAEFQGQRATETGADAVNEFAHERDSLLRVMDIPGPVLEAQDVPRLRHVGEQRIVAQ